MLRYQPLFFAARTGKSPLAIRQSSSSSLVCVLVTLESSSMDASFHTPSGAPTQPGMLTHPTKLLLDNLFPRKSSTCGPCGKGYHQISNSGM
ncbi:hypothetical protein L3Y34_012742 [Caenorhabditis briggsae]|uniref:Uncharacterized protein n=1 Tax=Caenorhabditis briggsae TaxID=6238 RepID=A0AAE9CW93_CAEBR|nr:hypothetical protein L3Y34_012742 [Caenorhabditis briggsae]